MAYIVRAGLSEAGSDVLKEPVTQESMQLFDLSFDHSFASAIWARCHHHCHNPLGIVMHTLSGMVAVLPPDLPVGSWGSKI